MRAKIRADRSAKQAAEREREEREARQHAPHSMAWQELTALPPRPSAGDEKREVATGAGCCGQVGQQRPAQEEEKEGRRRADALIRR